MSREKPPTALSGKGEPPYEEEFRVIGEILQRDGEQIMEHWFERAVEEQLHALESERADAMNELLKMLHSVGRRLEEQTANALEAAAEISEHHGRQRSGLKWDIASVVRDYEILHGVALQHLGEVLSERLTYRQAIIIASVMDRAIGSAVQAFSEMTDRNLQSQVKRQQAELRQLTLDLTEAEHRERQQIAETLHDEFQQILVAARMKLESGMRSSSPSVSSMRETYSLLNEMLKISRNLTTDLHPAVLQLESLPAAIQWLAGTFEERYGLTVAVDASRCPPQCHEGPMLLRRLIYDAVRELLFNVVKHAQTDQAWVKICCGGSSPWRFEIEDRGVGFEQNDTASRPASLGVTSVRRRISEMGGTMTIDSEPGRGTRIELTVPVEEPHKQDE